MKYDIRPATREDVKVVADNIRRADEEELQAMGYYHTRLALLSTWLVSRDTTCVGVADGEIICMFGVAPPSSLLSDIAKPWMISTHGLEFHSKVFLRRSRDVVRVWAEHFSFMRNYVDERNKVAVKWLQWVGFSVYYPEPYGPLKMPFHPFEMRS